jgi:glyoxylase-like metal-dependent hydrolase (beta-lactamase superfamily II)
LLRLYRLLPNHLLELALACAATLRWAGEDNYQGSKHNVISFALTDGTLLTLYFAAHTNLLSKYEILTDDFAAGDTVMQNIYPGYRNAGKLKVPIGFNQRIGGELVTELKYEAVEFSDRPAQGLFEAPAGFQRAPAPSPTATVSKIAKDVYLIRNLGGGNYNVLFVAFNDYVLVVEAPLSSAASQAAIAMIRKTAPGKPIRYIIPTHHHDNHVGGVRGYLAQGTTIITTPSNRRFFETIGRARRTLAPDALSENPRPIEIEVIEGQRRVFEDATHRVEIYDVGPTPHAREIVIAYLPQQRIIFQGDLFTIRPDGEVETARDSTIILAEKIRALGLRVEQIIGVHGSRAGTMHDLRLSLDRRQPTARPRN